MKTNKKLLNRVDNYISCFRQNLFNIESLSRINTLMSYYKDEKDVSSEQLFTKIESAESLSGNLMLPLKVGGVFLTEGRPLKKYYSAGEIELSASNPINQKFPFMIDHKNKELVNDNTMFKTCGNIIGAVTKIWYDSSIKGNRWEGHINDKTMALNVLDGVIGQVSVTVLSNTYHDDDFGLCGTNLTYDELSLVRVGADPHNSISVIK